MAKNILSADISVWAGKTELITGGIVLNDLTYCLIGRNGCGKTSLLNYLAQRFGEKAEKGENTGNIDVYHVRQEMSFDTLHTVYTLVAMSNRRRMEVIRKMAEYELGDVKNADTPTYEEYAELSRELVSYDYNKDETLIRRILHKMGFTSEMMDQRADTLSGGWRQRCAIACGIYMQPRLLLMDEPTNHLDLESRWWLANELKHWTTCVVVVSHDSWFISQIANYCIEIADRQLIYYKGDYEAFLEARFRRYTEMSTRWEKRQKEVVKAKAKGRLLTNTMPKPTRPYTPKLKTKYLIEWCPRLSLDSVSVSYGDKCVIDRLTMDIPAQARVAFVGPNGAGKSTLLKLIAGEMSHLTQTSGKTNIDRTDIGWFSQSTADTLPLTKSALQYIYDKTAFKHEYIRESLGNMGLTSEQHVAPMIRLSGGQRCRVQLAYILQKSPPVLVLDEPTNHLDIETCDALSNFFHAFTGTIIIATHNMAILKGFDIFEIPGNGSVVSTTLDEYLDKLD
jgi:ATP-binding cassette subfamily F protein 2